MRGYAALRSSVRKTYAKEGCKVVCNTSHYPGASAFELLKVVAQDIEEFAHPDPRPLSHTKRNVIHAIPRNNVVAVYTDVCNSLLTHEEVVFHVQSTNPSGVVLIESMLRSRARVTLMSL